MRNLIQNSLFVFSMALLLVSCTSEPPTGGGGDGETPATPVAITPGHNQVGQETQLRLVWRASDPNGDPLTYALYFGATEPPPLLVDGLTDTTYTINGLRSNCEYFWKVVASDPGGHQASSRTYTFATTDEFRFPLAVGNRWGYTRELLLVGVDLSEWTGLDTLSVGTATMEVVADTLFQDSILLQIVTIDTEPYGARDQGRMYVRNTPEGRITHGYEGFTANLTPGRLVPEQPIVFQGRHYNSLSELVALITDRLSNASRTNSAVFIEDPPVVALKYPLEPGQRWTYRQGQGLPFRIDKRVTGLASMETPAGKFECTVVRWLYDFDQDGSFEDSLWIEDYVAPQGLIRRAITLLGVVQMGGYDNSLDTVALYDYFETYELSDFAVE